MIIIKNRYKIVDDYVIIYLDKRNGDIFETYIDLEDFEKVDNWKYKWSSTYARSNKSYYTQSTYYLGYIDGKPRYKTKGLSYYIMDCPENLDIHHKNHNTLDNRKNNLKVTKRHENAKDRNGKNSNNTSGYRNVSWSEGYKKWLVQLQINGKNICLGKFDNVDKAGKFAKEMRQKYYKEHAGKG